MNAFTQPYLPDEDTGTLTERLRRALAQQAQQPPDAEEQPPEAAGHTKRGTSVFSPALPGRLPPGQQHDVPMPPMSGPAMLQKWQDAERDQRQVADAGSVLNAGRMPPGRDVFGNMATPTMQASSIDYFPLNTVPTALLNDGAEPPPTGGNEHGAPTDAPRSVTISPTGAPAPSDPADVLRPQTTGQTSVLDVLRQSRDATARGLSSVLDVAKAVPMPRRPAQVTYGTEGMKPQSANVPGHGAVSGYALPSGDVFVPGHGSASSGFWPNRVTPVDMAHAATPQEFQAMTNAYHQQQEGPTRQMQAEAAKTSAEAQLEHAKAAAGQLRDADRKAVLTIVSDPNMSAAQKIGALKNLQLGEQMFKAGGNTEAGRADLERGLNATENAVSQSDVLSALQLAGLSPIQGADRSVTPTGQLNIENLADAIAGNEKLRSQGIGDIASHLRRSNIKQGFEQSKRDIATNLIRYARESSGKLRPSIGALNIEDTPLGLRVRGPHGNIDIPLNAAQREGWWFKPTEDVLPTFKQDTINKYRQRADVLGQLLEQLMQPQGK